MKSYFVLVTAIDTLKPNGKYMYHLIWQSVILSFVFMGCIWFYSYDFLKHH
jgi:hypothetical protein